MTDTPSNPNEIERDLAQTRARLDATIDALQQRLSPGEMVDQAIGYVKESGGGEFGRNLMLTVRDHPIPVALIGVGVAWLMLAGPRRDHDGDGVGTRSRWQAQVSELQWVQAVSVPRVSSRRG